MKNILIISNTYYQLILAIQLNETIFKNDNVYLLLSDHSKNSRDVFGRIEKEHVFFDAGFINSKGKLGARKTHKRIKDLLQIACGHRTDFSCYLKCLKNSNNIIFDEIIAYNIELDVIAIYAALYEKNHNISISMYEEGILSYGQTPKKTIARKILNFMRRCLGKKDLWKAFKHFYCFYPEAYKGELVPVKIPIITDDGKCSEVLKNIFRADNLTYREKYIYFTSVYDFEGEMPIGEYQVIDEISKVVGKDNLLIKMHPRDSRTIFHDNGFNVDLNSAIPWEAIQLCRDFSDKILLSTNSTSILSTNLMTKTGAEAYYTYKLCDISNNTLAKTTTDTISKILKDDSINKHLSRVHVIIDISEILD